MNDVVQLLWPFGLVSGLILGLVGLIGLSAYRFVQQRERQLALLHRASQSLISSLDLDQVLISVLEEVRGLLNVVACSVWLVDETTNELVCRQSVGPQSEVVRGWRLAPGEGILGWVVQQGQSLVIPDAQADQRHYPALSESIGITTRSLLSMPLLVQGRAIGVLQALDTGSARFSKSDLTLLEPLAATAAIAIENARLYKQARQDAETKSILLNEINHRVKNNLSAIIGLIYTERRHAGLKDDPHYQSIMQGLINRVQGLATVHNLLSESEWAPLSLSEVASRVIYNTLQALPRDQTLHVEVAPSPVRVTPNQANNLALIINELTTNTVKHVLSARAASPEEVKVTVSITQNGDVVLLSFRDNGPGYPPGVLEQDPQCYGTGFDLIESLVGQGLDGKIALYNDGGAVAAIRFEVQVV